ncbi:hypothetical protein ACFVT1_37990 [Streptomyces sp. NPDC057963]|uniref:hypothetical protein n=1 Tax=Streptomyces sp. NPDC057963 TaxID=3346290 RepID=UPI0036EE7632
MADQQLDVFDGEDEEERLWEALSSFKKVVHGLVEKTGLSTNELADRHGFGKGKVSTWQNAKREQPNIPPLRFVEVLINEARERANLQEMAADVFLRQYGELLQLYCARANPHNVHRQMLIDYQNTLLIRELNGATNAALEKMAGLTEELQTLREDRDGERRRRITLQQQVDSLRSQNQDRAAEKKTALAQRDQIRADLTAYERDQQLEKWKPGAEQGGSHTHHPHEPVVPLPPPPGRGTKRRGLVLALIAVGVLAVSLAVYAGTQLSGDRNDHKGTTSSGPGPTPAASTDGSAAPSRPPSDTTSAGTSATPPVAGDGPVHGGSSSSGGGGSSSSDTTGGSSGSASGDASGGDSAGGTSGAATAGTSGATRGTSGGSPGAATSGSSGDSNEVPSYFINTWTITNDYSSTQPKTVIISRAATDEHAVRFILEGYPGQHCELVAKLVSVADHGRRINIGSALVDKPRSPSFCSPLDPSHFDIADPSGIDHTVAVGTGPAYNYHHAS